MYIRMHSKRALRKQRKGINEIANREVENPVKTDDDSKPNLFDDSLEHQRSLLMVEARPLGEAYQKSLRSLRA